MSQEDIKDKKSNKVDPWPIIDTYFRDNPYYKSQHQIDSFNEFIYSEVNGIKYIITRENPLRIYKEAINADINQYRYEIEIYFGDLRDLSFVRKSVKNCEAVIHLAALIGIPYSYISPKSYIDTNVGGTLNILEAVKELNVEKFIHT